MDTPNRARQRARAPRPARHRGDAGDARARVLRRRRPPGLGQPAPIPLSRLPSIEEGGQDRAGSDGYAHRAGTVALPALQSRLARGPGPGRRLLPRPADHGAGVEPRARLPRGLRLPRVPQEALPRGAPVLADHRQPGRPRDQGGLRPGGRRPEGRPPGGPLRRPGSGHPRARGQGTVPRLLALRRRALWSLVVRGAPVARARRARDGAPRRLARDARRGARGGAGALDPVAAGRLVGRGGRPPGLAQPQHRVDLGPRLQRRGGVGRAPDAARPRRAPRAPARAHPGDTGALAAPVLRLAVPDHDRHRLRLRRAAGGRALCRVQAALRDGARAGGGGHALPRRRALARAARARRLLLPGPQPRLGSRGADGGLARLTPRARLLAMIMAGGRGDRLQPLTRERSKSAVPFGGRHRLIDFVLSNFMNSDMPSLYVLVQYKAQSLIEHLRLAWRTSGLLPDFFVTVVPPQMRTGAAWYRGTADAVLQNLNLIDDFNPDVIAIFGADHIYRMDVAQMLMFHRESGAEVTVAARPVPLAEASQFGVLGVDRNGRVVEFQEKPEHPKPLPDNAERALASMGNYLFSRQTLVDALVDDARRSTDHDFGRSIIPELVPGGRVFAYDFQTNEVPGVKPYEEPGYWRDVGTIETYWQAQMDLLGESPRLDLDNHDWPIRTGAYPGPPARFLGSDVDNAHVAEGSLVKRSEERRVGKESRDQ